jgi:hypothetical protein
MRSIPTALLALAFLVLLEAPGCASRTIWKRETIIGRDGVFLYREHVELEGERRPQGFLHPIDLDAAQVAAILERLVHFRKPVFKDPVETTVFTQRQVAELAEPLAEALALIGPDERLRFLVTRSSLASLFEGTTGTSGVIFRTPDGLLHVAFDAIDQGVHDSSGGRPEDVYFPVEPTAPSRAYPLVPFPGSWRRQDPETGELHPRWLEIDLAALAMPPEPAASAQTAEAAAPAEGVSEKEARYRELRRKLENLKRLKEDGVLSEEEYAREHERLMKEL